MDLMGQLVRDGFPKQRRQEEVLHGVKGGGLVDSTLVVVLVSEDIVCSAWRWNRQWFG